MKWGMMKVDGTAMVIVLMLVLVGSVIAQIDPVDLAHSYLYNITLLLMIVAIIAYVARRNVRSDGGLRTALHGLSSILMAFATAELLILVFPDADDVPVWLRISIMYAAFPIGRYLCFLCAELTDYLERHVRSMLQQLRERRQFARWVAQYGRSDADAPQSLSKEPQRLKEPPRA